MSIRLIPVALRRFQEIELSAQTGVLSGLVLSFVREKSGGILAPSLLHGLPQAIASVAMLFAAGI